MLTRADIIDWLQKVNGVLVGRDTIVCRESYSGNSVIAKNSTDADRDDRGYQPVEHWIMSTVESKSRLARPAEGVTRIMIGKETMPLTELQRLAEVELFGQYYSKWPLGKILDIGGAPVKSSFGSEEVPPGAVEVHRGAIVNGHAVGPGKLEAYFYPASSLDRKATLRVGTKSGVTKTDVQNALLKFGVDDSMYTLLNEYEVVPLTGWTIPAGVLHSAAAYVTFEIQVPEDGYNAATWKFGQRLEGDERVKAYQSKALKGLADEKAFVDELIDWELSSDQSLKNKYHHAPKVLDEGLWGKRYQVFFGQFYGEGWEVAPGGTFTLPGISEPIGGVVWAGEGAINGNKIALGGMNELLVTPNTPVELKNTGTDPLVIYTFQPLRT